MPDEIDVIDTSADYIDVISPITDVIEVVESGPQGPQGIQGLPGAPGSGSFYAEYSFASPSISWVIQHNKNSYGINVETLDPSGTPMIGTVSYPDSNTVQVDWYYPTSGSARLFA